MKGGERGQVLPLIAVSLAVLMGFAGIAVDVAYLEYRQQAQQTATDAAAAGGAEALLHAGCPNANAAKSAALANAANNGFPMAGNTSRHAEQSAGRRAVRQQSVRSFGDDHDASTWRRSSRVSSAIQSACRRRRSPSPRYPRRAAVASFS